MKLLNQWHAAELIAQQLNGEVRSWYGYLTRNIRNWDKQHGYKITVHVENGKLAYSREALLEFVRVMKTPSRQQVPQ